MMQADIIFTERRGVTYGKFTDDGLDRADRCSGRDPDTGNYDHNSDRDRMEDHPENTLWLFPVPLTIQAMRTPAWGFFLCRNYLLTEPSGYDKMFGECLCQTD